MSTYDLLPRDSHKFFYGKVTVIRQDSTGRETLLSYGTAVMQREADGTLSRLWGGWSVTTGRHVAAFCGINKAEWDKMPVVARKY